MSRAFSFAVLGDMPYEDEDHARFSSLIERINQRSPEFSVHVGDVKKAKSPCDAACYQRVLAHFRSFDHPLIYTPGDNDWADCFKLEAGEYDPLERLGELRRVFFADNRSLGASPIELRRQGDGPVHPDMVENAQWRVGDTLFLTVHVTGDNINLDRDPETDDEHRVRDRANLDWIADAFRSAAESEASGVVLFTHANLWIERDLKPKRRFKDKHQQKGFRPTIKAIRKSARAFGRPVLVIHGDKHRLKLDQPLTISKSDDLPLDTVTRLQVMGAEQVDAVMVTVDQSAPSLFSFSRLSG